MARANKVSTPCVKHTQETEEVLDDNTPYRSAVGSLMYLAIATRPDIAFAVSTASQKLESPTKADWEAVKRIFKYLRGTTDFGILYKGKANSRGLEAYSDADFAGDVKLRKSMSGVVCKYNGAIITWLSNKQQLTALSTCEAEYIAASEGAKEVIWLTGLLKELGIKLKTPMLKIDNAGAEKLVRNPEFHKRTKHIAVKYHFVREKFLNGDFDIEHVASTEQLADIMTKPLGRVRFRELRDGLGLSHV
ncbi:hypothetical protein M514_09835 [Trichuris suis]|uniref:Reverse transcriptase Ty1/copia-type domain-containing protein n=1 Tax=Trichuris suis TaxID=68888 RepID=A0A085MSK2_9BILA|nr:hypothetical protein M514_09835 [Trichuris suis]